MAHIVALTLQVEMSTSLTRHLSIALDFASLAFITSNPQRSSASCHTCILPPWFICRAHTMQWRYIGSAWCVCVFRWSGPLSSWNCWCLASSPAVRCLPEGLDPPSAVILKPSRRRVGLAARSVWRGATAEGAERFLAGARGFPFSPDGAAGQSGARESNIVTIRSIQQHE